MPWQIAPTDELASLWASEFPLRFFDLFDTHPTRGPNPNSESGDVNGSVNTVHKPNAFVRDVYLQISAVQRTTFLGIVEERVFPEHPAWVTERDENPRIPTGLNFREGRTAAARFAPPCARRTGT